MRDWEQKNAALSIKDEHYPGLFRSANTTSLSAQKTYLHLQKIHLASLILGSVAVAFTAFIPNQATPWFYSGIAIILVLGILVLWVARSRRDDKVWFDCRAIAESTKTATWRFMMGTAPFTENDSARALFISGLREIREARPASAQYLARTIDSDGSAITDFISDVRTRTLEERKSFFINSRLRDQKSWYSNKAYTNSHSEARWFWTTTGLQGLAIAIAIVEATSGGFQLIVVPILTTCAAAVAAWSQMKRHSELAQTYALAAQELEELESIALDLTNEDDFLALVEQVEETISREHTMWCARRDVILKSRT